MLKKLLSVSIVITLLLNMMIFSLNASSLEVDKTTKVESENVSSLEVDETTKVEPEETDVIVNDQLDYIIPVTDGLMTTYYDQDNNVVDVASLSDYEPVDESTFPKTFDLRDEGRLTSVKDQGTEGFCWSFASMASMESNVLSNPELRAQLGENPQDKLDFSETGIPWYVCTSVPDVSSPFYGDFYPDETKGAKGGNTPRVAMGLSSGFGVHPEELIPYSSWGNTYSESLRFYSDYRLKEHVVLNNDPALIKSRLMDYGAVCVTYNCFQSNYYDSNDGMKSYYDNGTSVPPVIYSDGHMVVIVGWDDNYSKENFNPLMRPEKDGAWLCKNSWGEDFGCKVEGYEGYFWMSYETSDLYLAQFVVQSADEFDNIYQHQFTENFSINVSSAASIYTAERDEVLEQICLSNTRSSDATIEIYKLNENYSSPRDGVLLTSFDGSSQFSGTHTFEVPGEVELNKGDVFSVIVKTVDNSDDLINIKFKYLKEPKENKCFYEFDGKWFNAMEYEVGYLAIKAYTSNKDDVVYKDKLETEINNLKYLKDNLDLTAEFISEIEEIIANAENVLNDTSTTQNKVDNMVCLLKNTADKCNYAYYEINTTEDYMFLQELSGTDPYTTSKIVLNADLDFSSYPAVLPLFTDKTFKGEFDGKGHTISNMNINYYTGGGLFGNADNAVIKNVKFKNCTFNSALNTGTIAGNITNSTISDCTVTGATVTNVHGYAGGIAGFGEGVVISNCNVKDSNIKSSNETASGVIGSCSKSDINNCNVSNTEILGYMSANLYTAQGAYHCSYDNVTVKSLYKVIIDSDKALYNDSFSYNRYAFMVFEDDKFTIQPYLGEISGVSSDEATVTKVDKYYEVEINEGLNSAHLNIEYLPLDTNNFIFTFDIITNNVTLEAYYNNTDETITEVVFPSHIGNLPVTFISYAFEIISISPVKSIVLPETINTINGNMFLTCYDLEKVTIPASITTVEIGAFSECSMLTDVYYGGTQEQWNEIVIGFDNDNLLNANIHFTDAPLEYEVGDVNRDGDINIKDATIVQEYVAKYVVLDETQLILADVNMDNDVNIKDATYIQEIVAKLV